MFVCWDSWCCFLRRELQESRNLTADKEVELQNLQRELREEQTRSNGHQQDLTTSQNQETLLRQQIRSLGRQIQTEKQQAQTRFDGVQRDLADSLETNDNQEALLRKELRRLRQQFQREKQQAQIRFDGVQRELAGSLDRNNNLQHQTERLHEVIKNLKVNLNTAERRQVQASENLVRFNINEPRQQATPNARPGGRHGSVTTVGRRPRRNRSSPQQPSRSATPEQPIAERTRSNSPGPPSARQHSELPHTGRAARRGSYGPSLPYNAAGMFVESPQRA